MTSVEWSGHVKAGRLIGVVEIAIMLGVTRPTVDKWLAAGRIPEPEMHPLAIQHKRKWWRTDIERLARRGGKGGNGDE